MNTPRFPGMTAEASLYRSKLVYRAQAGSGPAFQPNNVNLASESCQCTSPNCTWQCPPPPPPPPDPCAHLGGVMKCRCQCLHGTGMFAEDGNLGCATDPYCYESCRCICEGKLGVNCWLM